MDLGKDVTRIDGRNKWTRHVYLSILGAKMAKNRTVSPFWSFRWTKKWTWPRFCDFQKSLRRKYFWKITDRVRKFSQLTALDNFWSRLFFKKKSICHPHITEIYLTTILVKLNRISDAPTCSASGSGSWCPDPLFSLSLSLSLSWKKTIRFL
jgi:hypothetical protein